MFQSLHRWLLIRLIAAWIVLSLLSGGLVVYLGDSRLDNSVMQLIKDELLLYKGNITSYLEAQTDANIKSLASQGESLIKKGNFIVIEIYDKESKRIIEFLKPGTEALEASLPKHARPSEYVKDHGSHETMKLDSNLYVRVITPITDSGNMHQGYMEGVYHVPQDFVTQIRHQTILLLAFVVVSIFATAAVLYPLIIRMYGRLTLYSKELSEANIGMLEVLGSAIAKRDSDTNTHNYRVTLYSIRIAEKLGLEAKAMQELIKGAFLHDVGKIGISDSILLKPGKLTEEEFSIMKSHVQHGVDIISSYHWLDDAADVVQNHHEKFDGSGYPVGLSGTAIPLNARIFAVADVFDALTSRRPYKEPLSFEESVKIIEETSNSHFDPGISAVFRQYAQEFYNEICCDEEKYLRTILQTCKAASFSE